MTRGNNIGRSSLYVFLSFMLLSGAVYATTYYADPASGNIANGGSSALPWSTLEEVISSGKINLLAPGDTLLLRNGYHGSITLSGNNSLVKTIAAEDGQKPQISKLVLTSGSKWTIKGLTISPSFGTPYSGNIVTIAEGGTTTDVILEDCFIYSVLNTSAWTATDWMNTYSGIFQGRYGTNITLRNNYVYNMRFGIALCSFDSVCEGNVIADFSGDGIRTTRDGQTTQYNVIKNCYVDLADGDANHDDAIQCFLFNVGTGQVNDLTIRGNVIMNHVDPAQKFSATMQGVGFFDGPLVNFLVEKNVVITDHWHGISLYDAQNCLIQNNTIYSYWWQTSGLKPWIQLGDKPIPAGAPSGNTVKDNMAMSFDFAADPSVTKSNNTIVTPTACESALVTAMTEINNRFGPVHTISGKVRLEGYTMTTTTTTTSTASVAGTAIMQIYPNPISKVSLGDKTVKFKCSTSNVFDLTIYDAQGNLLFDMPSGYSSGKNGNFAVLGIAEWDGTTNSGSKCSRGIYYYTVRDAGGKKKTGKFAVE